MKFLPPFFLWILFAGCGDDIPATPDASTSSTDAISCNEYPLPNCGDLCPALGVDSDCDELRCFCVVTFRNPPSCQ